jgi:Cd(II)/Pb(II)-responsive transcriptional regulator
VKISELAQATHTQVATIRYYEREGLLPKARRSDGNYRIYEPEHVERLGFVRHCRSLDMTLDEIRALLRFKDAPAEDCGDVNALLDSHIAHVAARMRDLRQLETQLKRLRASCAGVHDAANCGILTGLAHAASTPPAARPAHAEHVCGTHGRSARASATHPGQKAARSARPARPATG